MTQLAPNGGRSGPGAGYAPAACARSPRIGSVLISSPSPSPARPYDAFHGAIDDEQTDWAALSQREDVNVAGFGARKFARHQRIWREYQTKRAQRPTLPPMNGPIPAALDNGAKGIDQQSSVHTPPRQMYYQIGSHSSQVVGIPIPAPNSATVSVPAALSPAPPPAVVFPPSALSVAVTCPLSRAAPDTTTARSVSSLQPNRSLHHGVIGSSPSSGSDGGVSTPSPTRISPTSTPYDTPMKVSELRHQRLTQQRAADRNDPVDTPP